MRKFNINGSLTTDGDLNIKGKLTIAGQAVSVEQETLTVKDNFIAINGNGTTLETVGKAGIIAVTGKQNKILKDGEYSINTQRLLNYCEVSVDENGFKVNNIENYNKLVSLRYFEYEEQADSCCYMFSMFDGYRIIEMVKLRNNNYDGYMGDLAMIGVSDNIEIISPRITGLYTNKIVTNTEYEVFLSVLDKRSENGDWAPVIDDDVALGGQAYAAPIYDVNEDSLKIGLGSYTKNDKGDITGFTFGAGQGQSIVTRDNTFGVDPVLVYWDYNKKCLTSDPDGIVVDRNNLHRVGGINANYISIRTIDFIEGGTVSNTEGVTTLSVNGHKISYDPMGTLSLDGFDVNPRVAAVDRIIESKEVWEQIFASNNLEFIKIQHNAPTEAIDEELPAFDLFWQNKDIICQSMIGGYCRYYNDIDETLSEGIVTSAWADLDNNTMWPAISITLDNGTNIYFDYLNVGDYKISKQHDDKLLLVDTTLTEEGKAADAKAVGEALNTRVEKVTDTATVWRVYGCQQNGTPKMIPTMIGGSGVPNAAWTLAAYYPNNQLTGADPTNKQILVTGDPKAPAHVANKKYVDDRFNGANKAVSYDNYATMIIALNLLAQDTYYSGQDIHLVALNVPDLWICEVYDESVEYIYTSDEDFIAQLNSTGKVRIGYYEVAQLETQKTDLTDYAKKDEITHFSVTELEDGTYSLIIEGV